VFVETCASKLHQRFSISISEQIHSSHK